MANPGYPALFCAGCVGYVPIMSFWLEGPVWLIPSIIKQTCCYFGVNLQPPLFSSTNQWEFGTSMYPFSLKKIQLYEPVHPRLIPSGNLT